MTSPEYSRPNEILARLLAQVLRARISVYTRKLRIKSDPHILVRYHACQLLMMSSDHIHLVISLLPLSRSE